MFGWSLGGDADEPSFEDGTGHVIGHFMPDLPSAGEAGVRPYIYVEAYPEADLWVATFRDPSGNVLGVWQQAHAT